MVKCRVFKEKKPQQSLQSREITGCTRIGASGRFELMALCTNVAKLLNIGATFQLNTDLFAVTICYHLSSYIGMENLNIGSLYWL